MVTDRFKKISPKLTENEPMKNHTTFKIGGPADMYVSVGSVDELSSLIKLAKETKTPYTVIGNGSNILVGDNGIRGLVIEIGSNLAYCETDDDKIYAQAGTLLSKIASLAASNSLSGMEEISGIPGTLGGAIYMNAGAYGGEIKNVIKNVTYVDSDGEIITVTGDECNFGYRQSIFTDGQKFIVSSELELKKDDKSAISERMADFRKRRCDKQPLTYPSAGSTFKRPEGYFAGALIEQAGLKGYSIGDATVSDLHAGFVINCGDATAKDVLDLISHIQKTVYDKFGVKLEPEVRILGE
jgi:UDP-N-acetylmuramate dehydrogenase